MKDHEKSLEQITAEILSQLPSVTVPGLFKGERAYIFHSYSDKDAAVRFLPESMTKIHLQHSIQEGSISTSDQFLTLMSHQPDNTPLSRKGIDVIYLSADIYSGLSIRLLDTGLWDSDIDRGKIMDVREWFFQALAHPSSDSEKTLVRLMEEAVRDFDSRQEKPYQEHLERVFVNIALAQLSSKLGKPKDWDVVRSSYFEVVENYQTLKNFWNEVIAETIKDSADLQSFSIARFDEKHLPIIKDVERKFFKVTIFGQVEWGKKEGPPGFTIDFLTQFFSRLFTRHTDEGEIRPQILENSFQPPLDHLNFALGHLVLRIE